MSRDAVRNYLSLFSFLLQGLPSYGSPTSMMAEIPGIHGSFRRCLLGRKQTKYATRLT